MEESETVHKVRYRQGAFVVTIPKGMAERLGLWRDRYIRIMPSGGRIIVNPMPRNPWDGGLAAGGGAGRRRGGGHRRAWPGKGSDSRAGHARRHMTPPM